MTAIKLDCRENAATMLRKNARSVGTIAGAIFHSDNDLHVYVLDGFAWVICGEIVSRSHDWFETTLLLHVARGAK
jgi:hypothetical protein